MQKARVQMQRQKATFKARVQTQRQTSPLSQIIKWIEINHGKLIQWTCQFKTEKNSKKYGVKGKLKIKISKENKVLDN